LQIGVLALQGDFREHIALLTAIGASAIEVRTEQQLAAVSGLVIPGGESTAISKLMDIFGLLGPIRERILEGLPVLGTCAGLILLSDRVIGAGKGQHFVGGLPITVERNAYGSQLESFEYEIETPIGRQQVAFIRAPKIRSIDNPAVEVLAQLNGEPIAVRYGNVFGAAFHPELTGSVWLHELFLTATKSYAAR
jgi:5'-phosphate synthase pdxT subunit